MNPYTYYNFAASCNSFYKSRKLNFNTITDERIEYLKEQAQLVNDYVDNKEYGKNKIFRYIKIMDRLNTVCGENVNTIARFRTETPEEKFLLFIFAVDPEFEAAIIYLSENNKLDIKRKLHSYFCLYDPNLVKIELKVIKQLLEEQQKKEIYEEADKRAFK